MSVTELNPWDCTLTGEEKGGEGRGVMEGSGSGGSAPGVGERGGGSPRAWTLATYFACAASSYRSSSSATLFATSAVVMRQPTSASCRLTCTTLTAKSACAQCVGGPAQVKLGGAEEEGER